MLEESLCFDFINRVLKKAKMDENGFNYDGENSDLDRLYISIDNEEYCIRMWNISEKGRVDYTLYKIIGDHGEDIESGYCYFN